MATEINIEPQPRIGINVPFDQEKHDAVVMTPDETPTALYRDIPADGSPEDVVRPITAAKSIAPKPEVPVVPASNFRVQDMTENMTRHFERPMPLPSARARAGAFIGRTMHSALDFLGLVPEAGEPRSSGSDAVDAARWRKNYEKDVAKGWRNASR